MKCLFGLELCRIVCAAFLLATMFGTVVAEEFAAILRNLGDGQVTVSKPNGVGGKREQVTLPLAKDVKILKGKINVKAKKQDPGEELPGGLDNEELKNGLQESRRNGGNVISSWIITDDHSNKIKEIRVYIPQKVEGIQHGTDGAGFVIERQDLLVMPGAKEIT